MNLPVNAGLAAPEVLVHVEVAKEPPFVGGAFPDPFEKIVERLFLGMMVVEHAHGVFRCGVRQNIIHRKMVALQIYPGFTVFSFAWHFLAPPGNSVHPGTFVDGIAAPHREKGLPCQFEHLAAL